MKLYLTAALAIVSASPLPAHDPSRPGKAVQLPQTAAGPVLTLDFEHRSDVSATDVPFLTIEADGRACVCLDGNPATCRTARIPEAELQTLLNDLLVRQRLLDCQTAAIERTVREARRQRRRPQPGRDAATTVIRVRTASGAHEVRCHALGLTASQLSDLEPLRRLFACQQRLQNVAAIVRAGGYEQVHAVVTAANTQLKRQAPEAGLLTCRDLNLVDLRPDGSRYLQFSRVPDLDGLQPAGGFVMVSVYQTPGRQPEITVTADPS